MIANLFTDFLNVSLTTSLVIIVVFLISLFFGKRYTVKWKYWILLVLAIRLLLPFNFPLTTNFFEFNVPETLITDNTFQEQLQPVNDSEAPSAQPAIEQEQKYTMPSFIEIIAWVWLILAMLFLLYHFMSYFLFRKEALRWSQSISNQNVASKIKEVFTEMNVQSSVPVRRSEKVPNPMLVGFLRPILFLPHETYTDEELAFILKHEMIHYKRNDILYKLLLLVVQAIHWFNPFVWLMVRGASREIEVYCDYTMVEKQGLAYRKKYCEAILSAMEDKDPRSMPLSTNFSSGKKPIKRRFSNILNMNHKKSGFIPFFIVLLLIIISACTNINSDQSSNGDAETTEVSEIINEHLGISPYIPKTDYELGTVLLEFTPPGAEDPEPWKATISYFESLDDSEAADEEMIKEFEENDPLDRKFLYGNLYPEGRIIFIEVYPDGINMVDSEIIEIAGHDVQYEFLKEEDGRDGNHVSMAINFEDVGYSIMYSVQSDNIEEEAKKLAEDIIKNN